jgi:hypothetical protein
MCGLVDMSGARILRRGVDELSDSGSGANIVNCNYEIAVTRRRGRE